VNEYAVHINGEREEEEGEGYSLLS